MEFEVGDKVRLTGVEWGKVGYPDAGTIQNVTEVSKYVVYAGDAGSVASRHSVEAEWSNYGGYEVEKVETPLDTELEDLFRASPAPDTGDEVKVNVAVPVETALKALFTYEQSEAVIPDHYAFPGGIRVHQISQHLTSMGGQALQYIARSTRLDGNNKGNPQENLRKARRVLDLEIARLDALDNDNKENDE